MTKERYGCEEISLLHMVCKDVSMGRSLYLMGELLWINPETNPVPRRGSSVEVVSNPKKEAWVLSQMREAVLNRQFPSAQEE